MGLVSHVIKRSPFAEIVTPETVDTFRLILTQHVLKLQNTQTAPIRVGGGRQLRIGMIPHVRAHRKTFSGH